MSFHKLVKKISQKGGRNNQGVITVFHRGGGNPRMCRIIDFKRSLFDVEAIILKFEHGPRPDSKIALVCYKNGMLSYTLAPNHLSVGDFICAGPSSPLAVGNALPLCNVPAGTTVHNIELKPGSGGQIMRAPGTYAKIVRRERDEGVAVIRLHSGVLYSLASHSMATIGSVAKFNDLPYRLYKAGQSR
jgi:large subunit ribosomal protein L2